MKAMCIGLLLSSGGGLMCTVARSQKTMPRNKTSVWLERFFEERTERLSVDKVNVGGIARLGVLWDKSRNFAGFTTVINMNSMGRQPVDISSFYVRSRIFYGVRF